MATRVIAAQDKTSSGAGDDVQIKAGSANTSGAGGSIIIQPGAQATTGGNGLLIIRQPSGVAGTDEIQLSHDGGKGSVINKDGALQLGGTNIAIRNVANNANTTLTATTLYATGINSSNVINADGVTIDSYSWGIDSSSLNWSQDFNLRVGWSHIKGYANCGIAYTGNNTNGRRATLEVTDGSTGGGALAYRSATTTVNTSYNDLNLAGHSAFQRLNATAATTITGIAPASTAGGVGAPTWIHTDGRIFWLYNVGTFNITLSNESASSTAGNRVTTQTGANVVLGPGRMMQIVYDGTSSRWRTSGETYPYVFPTADGTNGQVLTTNGSGSLSWTTVSAGATASGTTNYIAKFTGASTLGNSLIFDNGTSVGIGTASPSGVLTVKAASSSNHFAIFQNTSGTTIASIYSSSGGNGQFYVNDSSGNSKFSVVAHVSATFSLPTFINEKLEITSPATTTKGLIVKGASGQTANLQEWQDSSGNILSNINSAGAFSGPLSTSVATFDNATAFLPYADLLMTTEGGMSNPTSGTYMKAGGTTGWNTQVYSRDGYQRNVFCSAKPGQTNLTIMFGLDDSPAGSASYTQIDYAWYIKSNGTLEIFENNVSAGSFGSYTTSTVLTITYDGTNIKYWKDGAVVRTVARAEGSLLYFDSSFYENNAKITDVKFGCVGQPYRIAGTSSSYLARFNGQNTLVASSLYESGGNFGIGSQFVYAKLHVESDYASTTCIYVRGASGHTASLQEWQDNGGTALAKIDNVGKFISSYNSASGLSTFSVAKTVLGGLHFANGEGINSSTRNEAAITFQGNVTSQAQAGIYVTNDSTNGTHMAFATTDSYATGPQLGLTITNVGVVNFPRARPTYAGASLTSTAGGTANYVGKFSDSATIANSQIFDNDTNVGIGTASPSSKLDVSGTITATSININNSSSQYLNFSTNSTVRWQVYHDGSGSLRFFDNVSNNTDRMIIGNGGNIVMGAAASLDKTGGPKLLITTGPDSGGGTGAARRGLVVKGSASQTANLTEWQDSAGTIVAAVSPNGAFTGSSFTPYGTFNSTTTIFGNNYWTPNLSGVSNPSTGTFTKTAATAAWDSQVYSSEGYIKNVYCASRASQTTGHIMFGLNSDPTTDANNSSLDYAWYFRDGTVEIYESGGLVANFGSYTTSTVLSLTYDGSNVQYWKDGVIQRTVARSTGNPLYFDTSFLTQNASLNNVQFGPIGQPFGISGTSGYHPKFTSQQTLGNSIVYDNGTNVGIGTASPADRLEVSGATNKNVKIGTVAGGLDTSSYNPDISTLGGIVGFQTGISTDYRGSIYAYADSSSNAKLAISSRSDIVFVSYKGNNADSRAMVIKETTGNVGIGTASPSFKLQVDAASVDANIVANVTSGYGGIGVYVAGVNKVVLGYAGANANYGSQTIAGDVVIKTNNSNLHINTGSGNSVTTAYFSSAGNVGIGTTSPSSKLEVNAGTGSVFRATFAATNQIEIGNYSVTSGYRELSIAGSPITLYTGTAGGISVSERVRIDSSGNVGVGTSTSLNGIFTPLHVNAVSSYGSILSSQATSTVVADAGGEIQFAATYRTTFGGGDLTQVARIRGLRENATASNWAGYLAFYTSTGSDTPSASTERMRINSSGNVGVGTASPGARLQVDTGATGTKGQIIKAFLGQTANLQEWQDSSANILGAIYANGAAFLRGVNVAASANGGTVTEVSGNYPTNNTSPYTAGAGSTASWGSGLAIDGSTNAWIDANGEGGVTFIKVVFNATYVIDRVRLAGRYDAYTADGQPQEFQLDFSDGSVQKFTFPASYTGMQEYNIRPVTTSFIRYTTISKYSTGNNGLRELEAYTRYPAVNGSMTEDRYIFNNVAKGTDVKTNVGIGTNSPGARLQIDTGVAATKGLIVRGSGSQTANLQEWQNSAGTVLSAVNSAGSFTNNGGYSQSEEFGNGATVSNSYATAIGYAAVAGQLSTAVGANAITSGVTSTALGADANADGGSTAVGRSAAASGGSAVAIGVNSSAVGNNSIAIGRLAASNGGIAIGYNFTGGGVGYTNFNASTNGLATTGAIAVYAGDGATNGNFSRQYSILGTWATATYASRLGRVQLRVNDYTTDREAIRYESDGANALTSIGGSAIIASTTLAVQSAALANKGLVVRGASGQSANLLELQNNAGTALAYVRSNGTAVISPVSASGDSNAGLSVVGVTNDNDSGLTIYPNNLSLSTKIGYSAISFSGTNANINVGSNTNSNALYCRSRVQVGNSAADYSSATLHVSPLSTSATGISVRGASGQSANLQEWQNNGGTALAYMDANGNFFAVSKSFLIPHPTPAKAAEGKKLRYASLEGPENGVYFRGRLEGENEIILPDYWKDLVDPESITVNLTARKFAQPSLFVVDANAEKVIVESDREICCDFIVYGTRKDIAKLEVEPDGN